ncbi:SDR family NAD(P)-dependent oxidoreductase [Sphingomonas kyeonggiensis]|uniref:3-oxoacyl-[acyl-carrier protein] reductase n=1 Tax=Sphingomonas kyeonggiensis TaxID=1268553 RepID=A0A7W6JX60_9SPHN|nr:3-oxoacyl-ACP reductase family protein [Sphingomonas kyeonggiensis]MBB4101208.1 3-oxoacyl-[acyl-carrier protein] reductase [Sphingomonas kyeonggiensis]
MQNEKNKTALVFGGSRGIGAAAVERLAREGFAVAFTYVSRPDAAEALVEKLTAAGGTALAIQADSADPAAIRTAVEQAVAHFGGLDAVVVNAGILRMGPIESVSLEELDQMLAINVRGVFLAIQAAAVHLPEGGRIITIGSNTAVRTGHPGTSVYQFTKAAVAAMVKGIALDLAARDITVNNVQPGPIDTDMNAGAIEMLAGKSPMRRVGSPAEIAGLIAYLAGPEAGYMTGESITIDGGWVL